MKLPNIAVTHPNNYAAAEILYREKYGKVRIMISGRRINDIVYHNIETNTFGLYDFNLTLTVLKLFGHLIPSLRIDYENYTDLEREQINQYINRYCAETVTNIEIGYCRGNEFANLTGPFKNTKNVYLKFGILNTRNVRFNEIFPNVSHLNLGGILYSDSCCFEHNFTQLEHLDINLFQRANHSKLAKILEINSHIRSISIYRCDVDFLKMINEKVPQLESLNILFFDDNYEGEVVHLKDLKKLTFESEHKFDRIPLRLESLEEFRNPGSFDSWFEIIIQNKHMKKLTISYLNYEQLMRIANELQELEEITTWYSSDNLPEEVVEFMETGKNLKRVLFSETNYATQRAVKQRFGDEWEVAVQTGKFVFLKNL